MGRTYGAWELCWDWTRLCRQAEEAEDSQPPDGLWPNVLEIGGWWLNSEGRVELEGQETPSKLVQRRDLSKT